ncbi:MAG: carbohydrate ABC transporter permease [Defluviitaleaceae bacterium]|nr:carbohydrate ABC transporter permease [Defluviitaleaceae bacterium]
MSRRIAFNFKLVLLAVTGIVFLFPLVVTFTNSFMSEQEITLFYRTDLSYFDVLEGIEQRFISFRLIPRDFSFAQYRMVLIDRPMFLMLLVNSVRITAPVTIGSLIISLLTAYGFTCWKWKHKEILFFIYIVVMLMPLQAVLVPNFIVADWLGITDNQWAVILPGIFAPFGTFLLRQSMKGIPAECYEAARIDGAGELRVFLYVVMPQMKSGIAALTMLVFIEYWNVVEQAVVFLRDFDLQPLSVFLSRIADGRAGLIFAASTVYMLFPFVWLFLGQEHLEKGIELSGIK